MPYIERKRAHTLVHYLMRKRANEHHLIYIRDTVKEVTYKVWRMMPHVHKQFAFHALIEQCVDEAIIDLQVRAGHRW